MELMLQFFIALFQDLPPLVTHLGKHLRKKVLVYTDASFAKNKDDNRVPSFLNGRAYRSSLPCPAWLLNLFEDRKTGRLSFLPFCAQR